ncbi:SAP domain-containing protein [Alkalibacillus sp. S2W]|uniref:SAP domain-containing protein n=1 Tax=Alkalibacillus sp. S2W TaxID=3386553 RepID=UPI00398CC70A
MGLFNGLKEIFKGSANKERKHSEQKTTKTSIKGYDTYDIDPIYKKELPNGLLPGEVILIEWISGKTYEANMPGYFEYNYGLQVNRSLNKLIREGYVEEVTPAESLSTLKVPELKEVLKSKQLKVSGKKDNLIERVKENFSTNEISNLVESNILKASTKGEDVLNEYYYIVPAHRNDSKDGVYNVANAIRHVKGLNYKPNNGDISWALFQASFSKNIKELKYGLMRNDLHNMAKQLRKEERYSHALFNYFRVFIYDTSGLNNGRGVHHPKIMMYDIPSAREIKKLKDLLELNEDDFRNEFSNAWDKTVIGLEFHYLTETECYECIIALFNEHEQYVKEVLYNAYNQIIKNIDEKTFEKNYNLYYPKDFDKQLD